MIGGTMETAASFEARFAPSSYPTEPLGRSRTPLQGGALRSRRPDTERDHRVRLRGARIGGRWKRRHHSKPATRHCPTRLRGEGVGAATVDLNGHEARNGGHSKERLQRISLSPSRRPSLLPRKAKRDTKRVCIFGRRLGRKLHM